MNVSSETPVNESDPAISGVIVNLVSALSPLSDSWSMTGVASSITIEVGTARSGPSAWITGFNCATSRASAFGGMSVLSLGRTAFGLSFEASSVFLLPHAARTAIAVREIANLIGGWNVQQPRAIPYI